MSSEVKIGGKLSIGGQALAVLALLADRELCFEEMDDDYLFDVDSYAWYNGREKAVCLTARDWRRKGNEKLVIVFGEHRSSDNIFVDCFVTDKVAINPPTFEILPDEAYDRRRMFTYGAIGEVEQYIVTLLREYAGQQMTVLSWVCPDCKQEGTNRNDLLNEDCCPHCANHPVVEATGDVLVPCAADPRTWD